MYGGTVQISDEMQSRDGGLYLVRAIGMNGNAGLLWSGVKTYSRRDDKTSRPSWNVSSAAESSGTPVVVRDDPYWTPQDFEVAVEPDSKRRPTSQTIIARPALIFSLDNGKYQQRTQLKAGERLGN